VVGVAPDTRRLSVVEPPSMQFYVPLAQNEVRYPSRTLFVRSSGDAAALTRVVRRELQLLVRDAPFADVRLLSDVVDPQLLPWRLGAALFSAFAVLAIALASFGIGVVLAYMVALRQRELGVRMALGADRWRLGRMIVGEALAITAAGSAAGVVIAVLGSHYLEPLLAGTSATDPGVYVPCVVAVVTAGGLASALPARRAAGLDPSTALRNAG
jgi:ABC-type antimicrobial peptide transport system permease subunit